MNYVYSTNSSDTVFVFYKPALGGVNSAQHKVLIKGGHGVARKDLVTPYGVKTEVSDADLELLEKHAVFKRKVDKGFLTVLKNKNEKTEKIANEMMNRDKGAPLTPQDFESKGKPLDQKSFDKNKEPTRLSLKKKKK